jgi:hypothetical protein
MTGAACRCQDAGAESAKTGYACRLSMANRYHAGEEAIMKNLQLLKSWHKKLSKPCCFFEKIGVEFL